ncbi:MAG TPA: hypothetical protein VMY59_08895 [Candidatus Thermoplasmatota archaeon]|nr:hypothetical protein [Candidatus Thermoplasmatota archaeon]
MVWVKYKEKFHGKKTTFWKKKPTVKAARLECRQWNMFDNPYEHVSVMRTTKNRPTGLRKTKHRGIYSQVKKKRRR